MHLKIYVLLFENMYGNIYRQKKCMKIYIVLFKNLKLLFEMV